MILKGKKDIKGSMILFSFEKGEKRDVKKLTWAWKLFCESIHLWRIQVLPTFVETVGGSYFTLLSKPCILMI